MAPYREGPEGARPRPAAATEGAVADMVRQFADPYAFVRELVQNALDAGATRVLVRLERTADGLVTSSVDDDGAGMTRAIIEGPLLTLFVSSKEGDTSKIGKYGVGFVSVFALAPGEVTVETHCEGEAWVVRLRADHSYDLEQGDPREKSGTIVTLVNRMESAAFSAHAKAIEVALMRWCRHAERPIELTVIDLELAQAPGIVRIDTPLSVHASVSVEVTVGDATTIVGCAAGADRIPGRYSAGWTFAGFYNRGLTLFETEDEVFAGLEGMRFKVVSSHLLHTLSRDNVRRDDAFERAIDQVRWIAKGQLRSEVASELRKRAIAAASGGDVAPYLAALEAALSQAIKLAPKELWFPLASPIQGERALTVSGLHDRKPRRAPVLCARSASRVTAALAASGRAAVLSTDPIIDKAFQYVGIDERALVDSMFFLATELDDREQAASAVTAAMNATLAAVGAPVERIVFARFSVAVGRASIVVSSEGPSERLVAFADVEKNGRKWGARSALFLDEADAAVASAYRGSAADAARRGHLLARLVLIEHRGALSDHDNDRLLEAAFGDAT